MEVYISLWALLILAIAFWLSVAGAITVEPRAAIRDIPLWPNRIIYALLWPFLYAPEPLKKRVLSRWVKK